MSREGDRVLRSAVRVGVVFRSVAGFGVVIGVATLVPTVGALVLGEPLLALPYAVLSVLLFGSGLLARRTPPPKQIQQNEALVITTLAFGMVSVLMAVPYVLEGVHPLDALFESVSGVTTTGLTTLGTVEDRSSTFLLARSWLQWIGGFGFVALFIAIVLEPGVAARRLSAVGLDPPTTETGLRHHARVILRIYLIVTGAGIALLLLLGASPFDAVLHTFAGVSTGGFAPRDASLAPLDTRLQCGVLFLSLVGSIPLLLLSRWRRRPGARPWWSDLEVRTLPLLIAVAAVLLLSLGGPWSGDGAGPVKDAILLAVTAQTTAGFSTVEVGDLSGFALVVVIAAMCIGGAQGSTAGGIKILRLRILGRLVGYRVARAQLPPHAVSPMTLGGERCEPDEGLRAATIAFLFLGTVLLSWLPFLAYGYAPLDALFEVVSATATVGLSSGISRPELEPFLKGVLCMAMLLGRLEVFAVLVTLSRGTWFGRRSSR